MLALGKAVRRSDLNFSDFKRTYYYASDDGVFEVKMSKRVNEKYQEWLEKHNENLVGAIVEHATFGKGKITKIENIDDAELATIYVDFENKGNKRLALAALIENNLLKFL